VPHGRPVTASTDRLSHKNNTEKASTSRFTDQVTGGFHWVPKEPRGKVTAGFVVLYFLSGDQACDSGGQLPSGRFAGVFQPFSRTHCVASRTSLFALSNCNLPLMRWR